jgi:DNA replication and repair protein RecF
MQQQIIKQINLHNFRNFTQQKFIFHQSVVLIYGNNGIGKTNLLEAISLFGKNNGLRQANNIEMLNNNINFQANFWQVSIDFSNDFANNFYYQNLAINFDKNSNKKTWLINQHNQNNSRQNDLKNYLPNFICLTPQLEQLFILGKTAKRDYLDKIVLDLNLQHQTYLSQYQKLVKERSLILQQKSINNNSWLDIIEKKISELAIAIAFARQEAVDFFNKSMATFHSFFPKVILQIKDFTEQNISNQSNLEKEKFYQQQLKNNRQLDNISGKTNFGIHTADFSALFLAKNISASFCSTGEQKLIMLAISLARAKISTYYKKRPTILLFDEIFSHLDDNYKKYLLKEIYDLQIPAFFTATSHSMLPNNFQNQIDLIQI